MTTNNRIFKVYGCEHTSIRDVLEWDRTLYGKAFSTFWLKYSSLFLICINFFFIIIKTIEKRFASSSGCIWWIFCVIKTNTVFFIWPGTRIVMYELYPNQLILWRSSLFSLVLYNYLLILVTTLIFCFYPIPPYLMFETFLKKWNVP